MLNEFSRIIYIKQVFQSLYSFKLTKKCFIDTNKKKTEKECKS